MKNQKFELTKLDPNNLVELDQWESKLKKLVEENPFIEIVDKKTFEEGKKRRTNLRTGRTEVQKQDGALATFIQKFRKQIKEKNENLVLIVEPHEQKQQTEVDKYQKFLDDIKAEEDRKEEERAGTIKERINNSEKQLQSIVDHLSFHSIKIAKTDFESEIQSHKEFDFQEFDFLFDEMIESMYSKLDDKIKEVEAEEELRLENLNRDREATLNQMQLNAQTAIDSYLQNNEDDNLIETVDDIFEECVNWNDEWIPKVNEKKSAYIQKALDKIAELNAKAIEEQRKNLFEVREGLLDIIFQMDVENHFEKTKFVQDALIQECLPELKADFEKVKSMIEKSLSQKLELLASKIKANEIAEQQEEERMKAVLAERIKIIQDLGMKPNEDESIWTGFGLEIFVDRLYDEESIDTIVEEINEMKLDLEANEELKEIIAEDKVMMERTFVDVKNLLFETDASYFKAQSTFVHFSELRKQMIDLCDANIFIINNLR